MVLLGSKERTPVNGNSRAFFPDFEKEGFIGPPTIHLWWLCDTRHRPPHNSDITPLRLGLSRAIFSQAFSAAHPISIFSFLLPLRICISFLLLKHRSYLWFRTEAARTLSPPSSRRVLTRPQARSDSACLRGRSVPQTTQTTSFVVFILPSCLQLL